MKYKIAKRNRWWRAFVWDEERKRWDWIVDSLAFTKIGCKHLVKKYHNRLKSNVESKYKYEEFELE